MILATAGHVDHGKTTLVRALTGIDTDRLAEERRRGLTIELGYAYAEFDGRRVGFVDVPGHQRFVHTMVAGAHGLDGALLVVAADDGVMPQTREHLDVLELLGTPQVVPVLTRVDRVDGDRRAEAAAELDTLLAGRALRATPVQSVAAPTGVGLDALRSTLGALTDRVRPRREAPFRMSVDRILTLHGTGLVLAGTVADGTVTAGERLLLAPGGIEARVRSLHVNGARAEVAAPGERCALNVTGPGAADVPRGAWLTAPEADGTADTLDLCVVPAPAAAESAARTLSGRGAGVHVHLHAARRTGSLRGLAPLPDGRWLARLRLDEPVVAAFGDRLVLRDAGARHTLAGGRILDPRPPRRGGIRPERLAELEGLVALADEGVTGTPAATAWVRRLTAVPGAVVDGAWVRAAFRTGAGSRAPVADLEPLDAAGTAFAHPNALRAQEQRLLEALGAWHARQPQAPGLPLDRIAAVAPGDPRLRAAAVRRLVRSGAAARRGQALARADFAPRLHGDDAAAWAALEPLLREGGRKPPVLHHVAEALGRSPEAVRALMQRLGALGHVVRVAENRVYLPDVLAELVADVEALDRDTAPGGFTAAAFRDRSGLGRNLAIDLLEYFDGIGFTYRRGDRRRIARHGQAGTSRLEALVALRE